MDLKRFSEVFNTIVDNVNTVIHGKDDVVRLAMVAIVAGGHVLFEDVPGVGKSMLARALGASMDAQLGRVQCTPDMLPGDITGSSIIDTASMKFVFRPGPVFANILLVDEINRATPKTQSALLEAMAERAVSVDGTTHPLPSPFIVLATQNPVELAGTFPLPEAQLDRFMFKLTMGYPDLEAEKLVIQGNAKSLEVERLKPVVSTADILAMSDMAADMWVSDAVQVYLLELSRATREDPACALGAGPRASIALLKAAKVMAASDGRDTVYPEDVRSILRPVLAHRLMLNPDATLRGETVDDVLDRATNRVKAPLGVEGSPRPASTSDLDRDDTSGTPRPTRRRRTPVRGAS